VPTCKTKTKTKLKLACDFILGSFVPFRRCLCL